MQKVKRFSISSKMVAQVRFYETLYCIKDSEGTRVFTGCEEKKAREILAALNAAFIRVDRKKKVKPKRKTVKRKRK